MVLLNYSNEGFSLHFTVLFFHLRFAVLHCFPLIHPVYVFFFFQQPRASTSQLRDCFLKGYMCHSFAGYKLIGIVSHIGTSTHCGHYVAHIRKDGRWTIFNDDKVAVSKDPPLDMGYLYFFERLE